MKRYFLIFSLLLLSLLSYSQTSEWKAVEIPMLTPWTEDVTPEDVHSEYPRPQMEREQWQNLNGLWSYKIASALKNTPEEAEFAGASEGDGKILVPFPVESSLSGVKRDLSPQDKLWYQRNFSVPSSWHGQRLLLHFGASDWETTVWVNGKQVGSHQGGYMPFSFDITDALKQKGEQELTVSVWDPTDAGFQPVGKQSLDPKGIWYTSVSGIWQTVWIEPVSTTFIEDLKMTPDIDQKSLRLMAKGQGETEGYHVEATAYAEGKQVAQIKTALNQEVDLALSEMKLWSPDDPFLYDLEVTLYKGKKKVDEVKSYFGMRKISLEKDEKGIPRLFLNNEVLFHYGPLDQGYWPDGLYTAPTDEAMKFDIEKTKEWGFNMIRKHVKVEPARWYYYCDKIGLLVWQDMPNGDARIGRNDADIHRTAQSAHGYKQELQEMMSGLYNHPSIVVWIPFNEGWGQFRTAEIARLTKQLDPSRLVNATTGWADRGVGEMHDMHKYPGPGMFPVEGDRASVLGEFGGQALVVKDHLWLSDFSKAPQHYKTSTSEEALHEKYAGMMDELVVLKKEGLSAAVYTQTTDVEIEVNGIMSYDRKVVKFDEQELKKMNEKVIKSK